MGFIFPLYPDDQEQLLKIRRYLIGFRHTNGWTQSDLSKMISGTEGEGWVYDLESNVGWGWRISRLQAWPEPFGLRLEAQVMTLQRSMDARVHADPKVAPLWTLSRKGDGDWKTWQRAYLTSALQVFRQLKGISSIEAGRLMGTSKSAVNQWERGGDEIMLTKTLHYARVLGGFIRLELKDK